jgi:hypothetical protein
LPSEILTGEKANNGIWRVLQSDGHVFLLFEFAFLQPTSKDSNCFRKPRGIIEDYEAFAGVALL